MGEPARAGELRLVLPLPPSINHQYATVQGRRVLSRSGREFKALVAAEMESWLDEHPLFNVALFQRHYLALTITFYFASVLRRDLDGGLKIAQDALCEALGVNDNLVLEIHLSKRVDRHCPRIEVHLAALTGEGGALSCAPSADAVAGNGPSGPKSGHTDDPIATPTQSRQRVSLEVEREADGTPPLPVHLDGRPKRRRRRKQRSLEELAVRHRWN